MSIVISDISYRYSNQRPLFEHIRFSVARGGRTAVIGNNGTGKSTLLKLIAGELTPSSGNIVCSSRPYYIPQQAGIKPGRIDHALGVADKIEALHAIYRGSEEPVHYETLADDWDIESRCLAAIDYWGLPYVDLSASTESLSGGEKTKLLLAGLTIHKPDIVLLDEPTNHLDLPGRRKLYDYIRSCSASIIVVSHDIALLNLLDTTCELSPKGLKLYGGNYDFYREQKAIGDSALEQQINSEQSALRLARKKAQEVAERQQKRACQGERNKGQLPRILRKGAKDRGETTGTKLREKHSDIVARSREKLDDLHRRQQADCELRLDFENARLHNGKLLIAASDVNFRYTADRPLWGSPVDLEIRSGERIHLTGNNGTGKTTLVRLLTGGLPPDAGEIRRADFSFAYLDQQYSLVDTPATVLESAQKYNRNNLEDHELKLRLHRALFPQEAWDKRCDTLSGGEKMRLYLCCLMISNHVPDLFILDEPTNNLDLSGLSILTRTIAGYRGTLLVISHDLNFIGEIGITRTVELK